MTARSLVTVGLLVVAAALAIGPAQAAENTTIDDDRLPLESAHQQVISGETGLDPGSELTVRFRSADAETPALRQQTARVDDDGRFAAVFDMSGIPPNTTYDLTVHADGTTLANHTGTVVSCEQNCTDRVPETPTPVSADDDVITVAQGDTARIPVAFGDSESVTFSLGGEDVNYLINASVTDGDGDGSATILFDTANAGTDGTTLSVADDDDSLTVTREEPELPSTLDPASYEYRVVTTDGESETVVETLVVRSNESATREFEVDDEPEFGFEQSIYRTKQGETARLTISLVDAEAATFSIGGRESGYEINATVRDGNGDGRVTVLFDTESAGHDGTTLSTAAEADSLTVEPGSEVALDARLEPTDYDLSLYRGETVSDAAADIGTLAVQGGTESPTATESQSVSTDSASKPDADSESTWGGGSGSLVLGLGGIIAVFGIGVIFRQIV